MIGLVRSGTRNFAMSVLFVLLCLTPFHLESGTNFGVTPTETLATCEAGSAPSRRPAEANACSSLFEPPGPTEVKDLLGYAQATRANQLKLLRIAHYNLKQYRSEPSEVGNNAAEPKPEWAKKLIAQQIKREDPDILFLSEVGGDSSLRELSARLNDIYEPYLFEGNDPFSMMALLVRKTLPFRIKLQSYRGLKHRYGEDVRAVFTRDFVVADFFYPGDSRPSLSIASSHLRSPRPHSSKQDYDRDSVLKRTAQSRTAARILKDHQDEVAPRATIFLGDFNADVQNAPELKSIRDSGFKDAMDVMNVPVQERVTHSYFSRSQSVQPQYRQYDGIFVSGEVVKARALVSATVVQDRDEAGNVLPVPKSHQEVGTRASDHRMVIMTLDMQSLRVASKPNDVKN